MGKPRLLLRAVLGLGQLAAAMGAALFLPAWTLRWWQAWLLLIVFCGASLAITLRLLAHDPELLERRVRGGPAAEKQRRQQAIQAVAGLAFLATCVVPALDRRFGWTHAPSALALAGDAIVALGFWIVWRVFEANTYTSATIEIAREQRVITTGPYALVRHPMYSGGVLVVLGMPFALGSFVGLAPVVVLVAGIVARLLEEERFLAEHLPGYEAYRTTTRWRLVPRVW